MIVAGILVFGYTVPVKMACMTCVDHLLQGGALVSMRFEGSKSVEAKGRTCSRVHRVYPWMLVTVHSQGGLQLESSCMSRTRQNKK